MIKYAMYASIMTFFSISSFYASENPQEILDKITSRPGEVKGVVISQDKDKIVTLEQGDGKQSEVKTYEKKDKKK